MNNDRFEKARAVFHAACDLEPAVRRRFVEEACAGDSSLCEEVQALFDLEAAIGASRLNAPLLGSSFVQQINLSAAPSRVSVPRRIGKFKIVKTLGEGSMGVVYLAEEDHPRRVVALKVPRDWGFSATRLRRFQREADLLGRLQHPGIAQVYDAGVAECETDAGIVGRQPYFALERIEGERLLDYCAKNRLNVEQRLQLAAAIAEAVHHAHCRGVIHRDLKPSNILVDAAHQPKILDFGLSRALDAGADESLRTEAGQILGTIAYASPEQLGGEVDAVDARSDVYSLGVILFELLTGKLPLEVRGLDLPQAVRMIVEREPASAAKLDPSLRGDINAILAKALEKRPDRRYSSAAEFASDIRRHLNDEPIVARPITAAVMLQKALRRHRLPVAAACLALVGTLGGLSYGLIQARAQRDAAKAAEVRAVNSAKSEAEARKTAEREAKITDAVNQFINDDLLGAANPQNNPNRDIRMREVLDIASQRIEGKFADEPLVEAAIRLTLGTTYMSLGDSAAAEPHLLRCEQLREAHMSPNDPQMAETYLVIIGLIYQQGRYADAAGHAERLVENCRRQPHVDRRLFGSALASLGFMRMQLGEHDRALVLMTEGISHLRQADGHPIELSRSLCNLAMCHMARKEHKNAEPLLREALEISRKEGGEDHPDTLNALATLAAIMNDLARYEEAIPMLSESIASHRRVFGDEHPRTLICQANLAFSYMHAGRLAEAEPLIDETLAIRERTLGESHPHTLMSLMQRGILLNFQEKLSDAEAVFLHYLELTRDNPAISQQLKNDCLRKLINVLEKQGRADEATTYRSQISAQDS